MRKTEQIAQVDRWCAMNNPQLKEPLLLSSNEISLGEPTDQDNTPIIISGAALVSSRMQDINSLENQAKRILSNSDKLDDLTEKQFENLRDYLKQLPETGCTILIDMARATSGFNPLDPDQKDRELKYRDYTKRLMECPFFNLIQSETSDYHRGAKGWDQAVNDIVDLYEGIEGKNKDQIKESLKKMASAAASRIKQKQTKTLYTQTTIQSEKKEITVWIYNSKIDMLDQNRKGGESKQTDIFISRVVLKFYTNLWPDYTERVIKKHINWTDKWLDENTTKPGNKEVNLTCLS